MSNDPAPAIRGLKLYSEQLLKSFIEMQDSITVLKHSLGETVPGFSASYEKHHANLKKEQSKNSQRNAAWQELRRDFEELTQVIQELCEKR